MKPKPAATPQAVQKPRWVPPPREWPEPAIESLISAEVTAILNVPALLDRMSSLSYKWEHTSAYEVAEAINVVATTIARATRSAGRDKSAASARTFAHYVFDIIAIFVRDSSATHLLETLVFELSGYWQGIQTTKEDFSIIASEDKAINLAKTIVDRLHILYKPDTDSYTFTRYRFAGPEETLRIPENKLLDTDFHIAALASLAPPDNRQTAIEGIRAVLKASQAGDVRPIAELIARAGGETMGAKPAGLQPHAKSPGLPTPVPRAFKHVADLTPEEREARRERWKLQKRKRRAAAP